MSLLSVAPTDTVEQLIDTFKQSRIYTSDGTLIPPTSRGLLSKYFPNNRILIYLLPDAEPINMGTPIQPLTFNLSAEIPIDTTLILTPVDVDEPTFQPIETFQPIQPSFQPIPTRSVGTTYPRTVSPPPSRMTKERTISGGRSNSPYRERSNSPFKVRQSELLHQIDPQKLSYERSTIDNNVYSTNDLIFLLMERGIEPSRSKMEMVDVLRIVFLEEQGIEAPRSKREIASILKNFK
jgi:hypothetical protein